MRRIKQPQVSQAASRSTARPGASSSNVATTSQRSSAVGMGKDEFTNLVNNTVYYILVADQHKTPIKTERDTVSLFYKDHSKSMKKVLKEAKQKLSEVFGYQLIDRERPGWGTYIRR
uniref:MAGE domain-containing protein n=1 Tax=Ixodes ricinus TaxID=34613 RepID=A0A090XDA5_IXORI